jgi:hypothetical protein
MSGDLNTTLQLNIKQMSELIRKMKDDGASKSNIAASVDRLILLKNMVKTLN